MKVRSVTILRSAAAVTAGALALFFPNEAAASAVNSIDVCLGTIIPSMFAFMAITTYILSSGVYRVIFRPVLWLARKIVKADDRILSVFLLSLFGGYPIGVKLLKEIIAENKNSPEAVNCCRDSSMFCYCISPTFALIMLGNGVFGSTGAGAVIYISNVLACIITAAAVSRSCKLKAGQVGTSVNGGIVDAVNSASRALFTVCTVIVAFNTLIACLGAFAALFGITFPPLFAGALEISNLLKLREPSVNLIPIVSAIASAGGICVLLQCTAVVKGAFPVKRFIIARIPCAALSALISWILLQFFDISVSVSTLSSEYTYTFSANKVIVLILIAMCIIIFHKSDKILKKV